MSLAKYVFPELCQLFGVGMAIIRSLKLLKLMSHDALHKEKSEANAVVNDEAIDTLICWAIFAAFQVYVSLLEPFVRWIPAYYSFKGIFILVISFPMFRVSNMLFKDVLIPSASYVYAKWHLERYSSFSELFATIPFLLLYFIFPPLGMDSSSEDNDTTNNSENIVLEETEAEFSEFSNATVRHIVHRSDSSSTQTPIRKLSRRTSSSGTDEDTYSSIPDVSLAVPVPSDMISPGLQVPSTVDNAPLSPASPRPLAATNSKIHESNRRLSQLAHVVHDVRRDTVRAELIRQKSMSRQDSQRSGTMAIGRSIFSVDANATAQHAFGLVADTFGFKYNSPAKFNRSNNISTGTGSRSSMSTTKSTAYAVNDGKSIASQFLKRRASTGTATDQADSKSASSRLFQANTQSSTTRLRSRDDKISRTGASSPSVGLSAKGSGNLENAPANSDAFSNSTTRHLPDSSPSTFVTTRKVADSASEKKSVSRLSERKEVESTKSWRDRVSDRKIFVPDARK